jgi:hypothetical protein
MNNASPIKGAKVQHKQTNILPDGSVTMEITFADKTRVMLHANQEQFPRWVAAGMEAVFSKILKTAVGVDAAKKAVQHAREIMDRGGFPSRMGSTTRKGGVTDLALAIAEADGLPVERVQEHLDAQELEQKGYKRKLRGEPRYAVILARMKLEQEQQEGGEGEKLKINLH